MDEWIDGLIVSGSAECSAAKSSGALHVDWGGAQPDGAVHTERERALGGGKGGRSGVVSNRTVSYRIVSLRFASDDRIGIGLVCSNVPKETRVDSVVRGQVGLRAERDGSYEEERGKKGDHTTLVGEPFENGIDVCLAPAEAAERAVVPTCHCQPRLIGLLRAHPCGAATAMALS